MPTPLKREQLGGDGGEGTSCHALAARRTGPSRGALPSQDPGLVARVLTTLLKAVA